MHHIKYPSDPDLDSLENVQILCINCHRDEHGYARV
jgi:5-methylcytosine-specific restriction endonuclease McrA